jgi:hypothetical protein
MFPPWLHALCPEVAAHFTAFPYFPAFHRFLPVSTTVYASAGVCILKIAAALAEEEGEEGGSKNGTRLMLHAGSHLGALLHGGPIPWDDDVDALLPWGAKDNFLARCAAARHTLHPSVSLECRVTGGAVKVFVRPRVGGGDGGGGAVGSSAPTPLPFSTQTPLGWAAPFVDLFLYKLMGDRLVEVAADSGAPSADKRWRVGQALPARPTYFGGLTLPAPPVALAAARYDLSTCVTAAYDHRHEEWLPHRGRALRLDCCALAAAGFPFVVGGGRALVAGGVGVQGAGLARALDLRRDTGRVGGGGAIAGAAAVLEDAEAVPLVLVQRRDGGEEEGGPTCGVGSRLPCPPPAARVAVAIGAALASLASVIALAWWLPGRRRPGPHRRFLHSHLPVSPPSPPPTRL